MTIEHEGDQLGLPGEFRQIMAERLSQTQLNDYIVMQEEMLAGEPDSFAYKLALDMSRKNWENRFGMKRISLSYPDTVSRYAYVGTSPDDVPKLLGPTGLTILRKVSGLINVAAVEGKWPLEALEVHRQIDPEIDDEDMKSVLLALKLRTSSFDEADKILKSFYPELQNFNDSLSDDDRSVFNRINFDVELVIPPKPNENFGQNPQEQR